MRDRQKPKPGRYMRIKETIQDFRQEKRKKKKKTLDLFHSWIIWGLSYSRECSKITWQSPRGSSMPQGRPQDRSQSARSEVRLHLHPHQHGSNATLPHLRCSHCNCLWISGWEFSVLKVQILPTIFQEAKQRWIFVNLGVTQSLSCVMVLKGSVHVSWAFLPSTNTGAPVPTWR